MFRILMRLRDRRHRHTHGQGLVEFALILPVVMLFFVAVLDLGRAAAAQVALTNAAREGAFQAALTPTDFNAAAPCPADGSSNKVWCRIKLESSGGVSIAPSDVSVSCSGGCSSNVASGSTVTVGINGHFALFTPLMGAFFGGQNVTLSASATEHREWLPNPTSTPTPSPTPTPTPTPAGSPTPTPAPSPTPCSAPSAGFTTTPSNLSNVHAPFTLGVTDTSTANGCPMNSWTWSWGDGNTSVGQTPGSHTYNTKGTYYVTLTVANGGGQLDTSAALQLTVKP
jgi:hypothetical protein